MAGYKRIAPEIKVEVLKKIRDEGLTAKDVGAQYGVHVKTIYGWLSEQAHAGNPVAEIARLKKENQGLTALIGALTIAVEKQKRGIPPERWF